MSILWLLACTIEPLSGSDDRFARIDSGHHDPTLPIEVGPPGARRWATEEAVGECRMYGGEGDLLTRTTITAAGLPLVRQTTSGDRFTWTRRYRADGTLGETWVYRRLAGQSQELLVHELHDESGRLVSRDDGEWLWEYDELGRLTREVVTRPGVSRDTRTWSYSDQGRITETTNTSEWDGGGNSHSIYEWDGDRLVRTGRAGGASYAETTWTAWHSSGAPERGDVLGRDWMNDTHRWVETWTYDEDGRPLTWDYDDLAAQWVWRDGLLVREEFGHVREWDWDESGRPVYHVDESGRVQTWSWDDDGDLVGSTWEEHAYIYEGDCPPSLFELPEVPTPGPLPVAPKPPRPYGG